MSDGADGASANSASAGVPAGEAQRRRGATYWAYDCAACHGAEGEAGRGGARRVTKAAIPSEPVPVSSQRLARFATARDVFDFVRQHMPVDIAGELPEREYWDVIAFVLDRRGVALGDRALDADDARSVTVGAAMDASKK